MVRIEVLGTWNDLKRKIMFTIKHLKSKTDPETLALENQILIKTGIIENKREEPKENPEKWNGLHSVLESLENQRDSLLHQLEQKQPFLNKLRKEIEKSNHQATQALKLHSETKNQVYQQANQEYQQQLQALHQDYTNVLKKLDRVKNLVVDDSFEKLKSLVRRGEI